jgi:hypothetical protein
MTREEALETLELKEGYEEDDHLDAIDLALFQVKKEILEVVAIPPLLKKKVIQVKNILAAFSTLSKAEYLKPESITQAKLNSTGALAFLRDYESQLAEAKLRLSSAKNPITCLVAVESIVSVQNQFFELFPVIFSAFSPAAIEVNSRETPDTGQLIYLLQQNNSTENAQNMIAKELKRIKTLESIKN